MKERLIISMAGLMIAAALPLMAHHSFAAEYDGNAKLTLKGTIAKIDWMNPHIWIYIDAKDDAGKTTRWQCEGGPPNSLTRNGWTKDAVKTGDEVLIDGFRAKDGTNTCNARSIKMPDGRTVFAGTADDGAPKK
jgi:hypothetical protein